MLAMFSGSLRWRKFSRLTNSCTFINKPKESNTIRENCNETLQCIFRLKAEPGDHYTKAELGTVKARGVAAWLGWVGEGAEGPDKTSGADTNKLDSLLGRRGSGRLGETISEEGNLVLGRTSGKEDLELGGTGGDKDFGLGRTSGNEETWMPNRTRGRNWAQEDIR